MRERPLPAYPERSQQPLPTVTPKFVLNVSPKLKPYVFVTSPNWTDIVEAADRIRQQLGISRRAWIVSGAPPPRCLRQRVWDDGASFAGGERGSLSKSFAN